MDVGEFAAAAAAQGLAVNGDLASGDSKAEGVEMGGDAAGEVGGLDGLEDAGKGVGARAAVGELEPFSQPAFLEFAKFLHQFVGAHAAEQGGEGHEEDLAEVMAGVAAVTRVRNGSEGLEAFRESKGVVGFIRISWHSGKLNTTRCRVQIC